MATYLLLDDRYDMSLKVCACCPGDGRTCRRVAAAALKLSLARRRGHLAGVFEQCGAPLIALRLGRRGPAQTRT